MTVTEIQTALKARGVDPGPIDGLWGRRTIAAVKAFQASAGLTADGIVGPQTVAALNATPAIKTGPAPVLRGTILPPWYEEARHLAGTREVAGSGSSPVILGWAKALSAWVASVYRSDDIPWCGLFVAHCIGLTLPDEALPTNPLSALAWAKFGVPLSRPSLGAVAVFTRTGGGHVAFYVGEDATAIRVLGGNQSDAVTETRVARTRLLTFRWPKTVPLPETGAITVAPAGTLSRNEA